MAPRPVIVPDRCRVVAELPSNKVVRHVLSWQPIGLLLMVCQVLLVLGSIWLAPVVPLVIAYLYSRARLAALLVYFQVLLYQNLIISVFSPGMTYSVYITLEGTNFAVLCVLAAVTLNRATTSRWRGEMRATAWLVSASLATLVFYTMIGTAKAGPTSALIYFRELATPSVAVLVGMDVGRIWGIKTIGLAFAYSVVLAIVIGIIEYLDPIDYYALVHEVTYYQLKYSKIGADIAFYTPQDIVNNFTMVFLNITGTTRAESIMPNFRFGSSIITPTSFADVLSVTALVAVSVRRSTWLVVLMPMMFLIGAKGAGLVFLLSLALWWVWKLSCSKYMLIASGMILSVGWIASGIIVGIQSSDYHVVGFLGGVHGLMSNPLGHGIGVGGNLSAAAAAGKAQMEGMFGFSRAGAAFAVESAIGVLFYQTGISALLVLAVFIGVLWAAPLGIVRGKQIRAMRHDILVIAVAMIMVDGVFQEEAYSPYAAGMIMLLCSCIVANGRRKRIAYATPAIRPTYKVVTVDRGVVVADLRDGGWRNGAPECNDRDKTVHRSDRV